MTIAPGDNILGLVQLNFTGPQLSCPVIKKDNYFIGYCAHFKNR